MATDGNVAEIAARLAILRQLYVPETAAEAAPRNALAFASVGLAQLCIGDGEGAARSFQRSLQIDPNQPEIRRALGQIGG